MARQAPPPPDPDFVLRGHRADVQALLFHPSCDLLLSGDAEGTLLLWDLQQRRPVFTQRLHPAQAGILSLAWLRPDVLLSQGRDGTVMCWKVLDGGRSIAGAPHITFTTNSFSFCRCSLNPAAAEQSQCDATAAPCSLEPRSEPRESAQNEPAGSPGTERCRTVGMAGSNPATLELWRVSDKGTEKWRELSQPEGATLGMCMAVQLFHAPPVSQEAGRAGEKGPAAGALPQAPQEQAAMPEAQLCAAVGYEDGSVAVWDVARPEAPIMSARLHSEPVMALAVDAAGTGGVSGSADDKLALFSLDWAACEMAPRAALPLKSPGVAAVAVRQDGRLAASAGWDAKLRLWHYTKAKPLAVLAYHRAGLTDVCFDARTERLASASRDGSVAVWSIYAAGAGGCR